MLVSSSPSAPPPSRPFLRPGLRSATSAATGAAAFAFLSGWPALAAGFAIVPAVAFTGTAGAATFLSFAAGVLSLVVTSGFAATFDLDATAACGAGAGLANGFAGGTGLPCFRAAGFAALVFGDFAGA